MAANQNTERVRQAIATTQEVASGLFKKILRARTSAVRGPRYVDCTPEQLEQLILDESAWRAYTMAGGTGFGAAIPVCSGSTSVASLKKELPSTQVKVWLESGRSAGDWLLVANGIIGNQEDRSVIILWIVRGREIVCDLLPIPPPSYCPIEPDELPAAVRARLPANPAERKVRVPLTLEEVTEMSGDLPVLIEWPQARVERRQSPAPSRHLNKKSPKKHRSGQPKKRY